MSLPVQRTRTLFLLFNKNYKRSANNWIITIRCNRLMKSVDKLSLFYILFIHVALLICCRRKSILYILEHNSSTKNVLLLRVSTLKKIERKILLLLIIKYVFLFEWAWLSYWLLLLQLGQSDISMFNVWFSV